LYESAAIIGDDSGGEATLILREWEYTLKEEFVGAMRAWGVDWDSVILPLTKFPKVR